MKSEWRITLSIVQLLLLASVSRPSQYQIKHNPPKSTGGDCISTATMNASAPEHEGTKEIKVRGIVKGIEFKRTVGMHIFMQTGQGIMDADLGNGAAEIPRNFGVALNDAVEVIGVMRKIGERDVLVASILTTSKQVFILRNDRGILRTRSSDVKIERKRAHPQRSTPRYSPSTISPQGESNA